VDMWEISHGRATYTHYTSPGASRIDMIYTSRNLSDQKRGVETRIAAFTDHLAMVLIMALDVTPCGADAAIGRCIRHCCEIKDFRGNCGNIWRT